MVSRYFLDNDRLGKTNKVAKYQPAKWGIEGGERGHMNIPVVVEKMPAAAQKFFAIFAELIAMAFSLIILVYGGYRITLLAMGQMTSSLGVAVGVFYVAMPVCGVINILYTILNIYDICKGKKKEA